jgi:CelD/BcsL family acetyltransferase involved in cellulose biosynthesis
VREVEIVRTADRLAALEPEWNALLARTASNVVFLTWEWLWSWWETYGNGVEPYVIAVRESGRLIAVAPCKIEDRRRYGLAFRQLEFLGSGRTPCPDFLDLMIEAGREAELVPILVAALTAERRFDKLALTDIPSESSTRRLLAAGLRAAGLRPRSEGDRICPYLPLPATWPELEARLTHNFRRNHRKKRRRLGAQLVPWQREEDVRTALAALAALHQGRMESSGRGGNFAKPDYRAFHERFAERAAARGWLYLAFLVREGRTIAGRYGFLYDGTYYAYQSGFDPEAADESPGEVLLGMVLEDLIGRRAREFNFLRGAQPHKFHWTDRRRETVRVDGWARTPVGRTLAVIDRMAAERRRLRRRFPGLFGHPIGDRALEVPA